MRLLWLPEVLRAAGLTVHLYPGWEGRGAEDWGEDTTNAAYRMPLQGLICHATASSRTSTVAGDTRVLWETGSNTAPVPISQLYLARNGEYTVGASGRCNHALVGTKGPLKGFGNYQLVGIEAANDNLGEPWPAVQLDAYQRGVAAICGRMGWAAGRVAAHWEHQDGKSDPAGIDMNSFRTSVTALLSTVGEDMALIVKDRDTGDYFVLGSDGVARRLALKSQNGINDVGYVASGRFGRDVDRAEHPMPYANRPINRAPWIEIPSIPVGVLALAGEPVTGSVTIDYDRIDADIRDAVADGLEGGADKVRADAR